MGMGSPIRILVFLEASGGKHAVPLHVGRATVLALPSAPGEERSLPPVISLSSFVRGTGQSAELSLGTAEA
jgi:hypothetical protein